MVLPKAGDERGLTTYLAVQLGRMDLVQRRAMRIDLLIDLAHSWKTCGDPAKKKLLWRRLLAQADESKEFAAAVRSYLCEITGMTWAHLRPK